MPANFGPLVQNGYVVRDIERAVRHWTQVIGVGPFFLLEHIPFESLLFHGRPSPVDMSVAITYWGEMQIELIVQHNDAPSIYSEFAAAKGEGLQHVGVFTDDLAAHLERLRALGVEPVQWGHTATGFNFAYVSTDAHPGAMIELVERGEPVAKFFGMIREAARGWDGREPLRRLG
jgi:hypothetical protein